MPITIPGWVPPLASASKLQDRRITQTIAADSASIPVAYGEVQIAGRVFAVDFDADTSTWTIGALFCVGEVESVGVLLNGESPPAGVTVNTYRGTTSQTADALLSAAISGYTDTLVVAHPAGSIGICYAVIQYSNETYPAFPQILGQIEGRKVFNPATATTVYSQSPALALRDLITSPHFGLGDDTDDTSVTAATNANSELTAVGGEPRRLIGLVLEQRRGTEEWVEILATYAGCWAHKRGSTWLLVPDRPAATAATLTQADVQLDPPVLADAQQAPTVVRVVYTDKSDSPWRDREAVAMLTGVSTGVIPRRESLVRMPGIDRFSQAAREASERLAKFQRALLAGGGQVFDDHIGLELGDIIQISSHPLYPTHNLFRITEPPSIVRCGRLKIRFSAYSADDYDDTKPTASWGAGGGVIGRVSDIGTVDKTRIARDVSGQNLLGSSAGSEASSSSGSGVKNFTNPASGGGAFAWRLLSDLDMEPGELYSFGADLRRDAVTSGSNRIEINFRESDGTGIPGNAYDGPSTTGTDWTRREQNGFEVPATAHEIRIFASRTSASPDTMFARRGMLNKGPVALPFEQPPARVDRGEVEEGADVTADNPQAPDWLTALVDSGHIDASSVQLVLDVLQMINGPAEADADTTSGNPQPPSWLTALITSDDISASSVEAVLNALNMVNGPAEAGADATANQSVLWAATLLNPSLNGGDVGWSATGSPAGSWDIIEDSSNAAFGDWVIRGVGVESGRRMRNLQSVPCAPGSRFLAEGLVKRSAGTNGAAARITFRNSAGSIISQTTGNSVTSSSFARSRAIATAPANTVTAEFEFTGVGAGSGDFFCDGAALAMVPADSDIDALQTINAPAEADADPTATNPQAPSWLTALIDSGDIDAASVEAVLDALNMVNAPAEANSTKGVIEAVGSSTSSQQDITNVWTTVEEDTITVEAGEDVLVTAGMMYALETHTQVLTGSIRVLRGATTVVSEINVILNIGWFEAFSLPIFESPGAGTHTYSLQCKGPSSKDMIVKEAVIVAQAVR
jgi:hypothetical protein